MTKSGSPFRSLGPFLAAYGAWIALLAASHVLLWLALEQAWRVWPPIDIWAVRMYLVSGLLLFDNLCVLWWYADSAKRQAQATEDETRENRLARWRESKPTVFIELGEFVPVVDQGSDEPYTLPTFLIRNTGNGPALNVFLVMHIDTPTAAPIALGALGAHEQRSIDYGHSGEFRYVIVAEGLATRTRRWNATLNLGTRRHHVVHGLVDLGAQRAMGDDQHQTLDEFLDQNRRLIIKQLNALEEPKQAQGPFRKIKA